MIGTNRTTNLVSDVWISLGIQQGLHYGWLIPLSSQHQTSQTLLWIHTSYTHASLTPIVYTCLWDIRWSLADKDTACIVHTLLCCTWSCASVLAPDLINIITIGRNPLQQATSTAVLPSWNIPKQLPQIINRECMYISLQKHFVLAITFVI